MSTGAWTYCYRPQRKGNVFAGVCLSPIGLMVTRSLLVLVKTWILRARDRDRDILARLRFGHQRPLNRRCPHRLGHQRPVNRGCPRVSKPVSQDIQSICYCLHPGIFRLDTCDLVVAGVRISISPKYLYLYLALKVLTLRRGRYASYWNAFLFSIVSVLLFVPVPDICQSHAVN